MTTPTVPPQAEVDDPDPFEVLAAGDTVVGDVRDPYPRFANARREHPVELANPEVFHAGRSEVPPIYTVYRFEDVDRVLRDAATFSSSGYDQVMGVVMGHTILEMDGTEHHRHRSLVAQAFRPKVLADWQRDVIEPVVDELIDAFADRGRAELVREFTARFPIIVIAAMLGLPREHYNRFLRWSIELISVSQNWERGRAASAALREYFTSIVAERRREPQNDLISHLTQAQVDGHTLSDDEILPFLNLLLPAGAETTFRASGNLLYGLLADPDQLADVRDDRSLVPQAIEEAFRWEPPLLFIFRTATEDTEVGGVEVQAGSSIMLNLGSANRDGSRWEDAERYDLHREQKPHLAFASGPHTCLGMHLARLEMRVALEALLDRLPDLRLDPDAEDVHIHGLVFRSPTQLPVLFS